MIRRCNGPISAKSVREATGSTDAPDEGAVPSEAAAPDVMVDAESDAEAGDAADGD